MKDRVDKIREYRQAVGVHTSWKVYDIVLQHGDWTNQQIATELGLSKATVTRHIKKLVDLNMIESKVWCYNGGHHPVTRRVMTIKDQKIDAIPKSEERSEGHDEQGPIAPKGNPEHPKDLQ